MLLSYIENLRMKERQLSGYACVVYCIAHFQFNSIFTNEDEIGYSSEPNLKHVYGDDGERYIGISNP
jgi:hypothetical protein